LWGFWDLRGHLQGVQGTVRWPNLLPAFLNVGLAKDTHENNLEPALSDPINSNLMMNQQRFLTIQKISYQHLFTKSRNLKLLFCTIRSKN